MVEMLLMPLFQLVFAAADDHEHDDQWDGDD